MSKSFEDLRVWNQSIALTKHIYLLTRDFPKEEVYGLTSQIRRSAVSVPSNIAEGCARNTHKEFIQFLGIAAGSLAELKTQLIIAHQIQFLTKEDFDDLKDHINNIGKMLSGLKSELRATSNE